MLNEIKNNLFTPTKLGINRHMPQTVIFDPRKLEVQKKSQRIIKYTFGELILI